MKPYYFLFFLLSISFSLSSQNYKYGKVSKEELAETENAQYPEANATVLFREYKTYYEYRQGEGFTVYTEVQERIKIYNNAGFEWANNRIKTYNYGSDREEVVGLKGVTYNLENGSIVKEKLKSNAIFEERISNYYVLSKFTMPNIKPGAVIEYEYKVASPFTQLDNIDLQYTIPIKKEIVKVVVPEFYVYRNYSNPQSNLSFSFTETSKEKEIQFRERSGIGSANYNNANAQASGTSAGARKYKENIYNLEVNDVPPLKEENLVDNLDNYRAKSIWELTLTNFPGSMPETFTTTWEAVTKSIYENDAFVNQLNKTGYFEQDLEKAIGEATSPVEVMGRIFSLAKSKVKWNEYFGYYPENGVKKAYKDGIGNVADINLMLVSMLRSASLNANPVLVSTKANGIPLFPTRYGFNYVIAGVELDGKLYLLDGTDPLSGINLLPERAMNWQGRLIRPDGSSDGVALYPGYLSQNLTYVQAEINEGNMEMIVKKRIGGHDAKNYRSRFYGTDAETQISAIETHNEEVNISEFEVKDLDNLKPNLSISYKAISSSVVEDINDELYFSPMLFFAQLENPFKSDKRTYPIFFGYPTSNKYTINIKLPEGYQVKSMPEGAKATLAGNVGGYTYLLKEAPGNILQLSVILDLKSPIVLSQDYPYIKAMFSELIEKEKEKVVLTKI